MEATIFKLLNVYFFNWSFSYRKTTEKYLATLAWQQKFGNPAARMLSPKMQHRIQRSVRINDGQLLGLAEKARYDSRLSGFLHKRCSDSNKWLLRWFRLYQVSYTIGLNFENKQW